MLAGFQEGGSRLGVAPQVSPPGLTTHAQPPQQQNATALPEYDLASISPADLFAAAQQRNASLNIYDPVAAILLGIPERARLHETAIRVHPFTLPLPVDVKPNEYVKPWKMVCKRAAAIAAVDIAAQSGSSTAWLPASASIAAKLKAAGVQRAKQAAVDAAAALKARLQITVVASPAGASSVEQMVSLTTTSNLDDPSALDLDTPIQQQSSNVGAHAAQATLGILHRKTPAMYGVHPPDQIRFHVALAGFHGMAGGRLDLPLLGPNAPILDLRKLFLEVNERGGCSSVYVSHAWPELAKLLQRDESLGPLLGSVYRWLLLPVEAALPLEIRPARVLEWLEGKAKTRFERTEPLPSPVAVLAALNTAEEGILQWDQNHTRTVTASSSGGGNLDGNTHPVTRDVHQRSMSAAALALLLQMAARPMQLISSSALPQSGQAASVDSQALDSLELSSPEVKPRKRAGKALKGTGKRRKSGADASNGVAQNDGVSGVEEPLGIQLPGPELSPPLDVKLANHGLKSDLSADMMAVDLALPLEFVALLSEMENSVPSSAVMSNGNETADGALRLGTQAQTCLVSIGTQRVQGRNGASLVVKGSPASHRMVTVSAQDPGMVPHLTSLLFSFRQHQCAPPGCGAPVPDIKAAFKQRLATQEQDQATATAVKLTANATVTAGLPPSQLDADTPTLVPLSSSLFREGATVSLANPHGHTRPRLGSWDHSIEKRATLMAAAKLAGVQRPQTAGIASAVTARLSGVTLLKGKPVHAVMKGQSLVTASGKIRKRQNLGQTPRCGACKTCTNLALHKACLVNRERVAQGLPVILTST